MYVELVVSFARADDAEIELHSLRERNAPSLLGSPQQRGIYCAVQRRNKKDRMLMSVFRCISAVSILLVGSFASPPAAGSTGSFIEAACPLWLDHVHVGCSFSGAFFFSYMIVEFTLYRKTSQARVSGAFRFPAETRSTFSRSAHRRFRGWPDLTLQMFHGFFAHLKPVNAKSL